MSITLCKKIVSIISVSETPETFYTESWSHILTCEVKNTFKYFVGAINEAIKLPSNYGEKHIYFNFHLYNFIYYVSLFFFNIFSVRKWPM